MFDWTPAIGQAGDYDIEYTASDGDFEVSQIARITVMWVVATAAGGLAFPALAYERVGLPWNLVMVLASGWLMFDAAAMLRRGLETAERPALRRAFMHVNVYVLVVTLGLAFSGIGWAWG